MKSEYKVISGIIEKNSRVLDVGCNDGTLMEFLKNNKNIDYKDIIHNDKVSKVSIVGAGMVSTPGITYRMFRSLSDEKINILAISTSEIKLSVIIDEENTLNAIKKLHTIFDLD